MKKHFKYLWYIVKHRFYVARECWLDGLIWQGFLHDWSKMLPWEWFPYANYFYGKKNINNEDKLDTAWLKHQNRNKHHWQYWILNEDDGGTKILPMPDKYIKEMICDWAGAGIAQGKTGEHAVVEWYSKNKSNQRMHPETRKRVEARLAHRAGFNTFSAIMKKAESETNNE